MPSYFINSPLAIYGQRDGTGKLTAHTDNGTAIFVISDITINGGIVNATTESTHFCAIESRSDITINGGQVTATGTGIFAKGHTTLGLRKESDFIQANSYGGTVHIKEGLALTDGTTIYSGNGVSIPNGARLTLGNFIENADGTYTIGSSTGWNQFCDLLVNNNKGYFTGKTVNLGADITVNRMAGLDYKDFTGTFNGHDHTITIDSSSGAYALFRNVENGNIQNLHVDGTINASAKNAAGLISGMWGAVNIENCRSSVAIIDVGGSRQDYKAYYGGFVAQNNNGCSTTIINCVFDGKLQGVIFSGDDKTKSCGGFVGSNDGTVSITNSLFAPNTITHIKSDNSYTFCPNSNGTVTVSNSYYTETFGTAQGTKGILLYDGGVPATTNKSVISLCNTKQYDVKLQGRTLYKDGDWNTLCLPFAVTIADSPLAGADVRALDNANLTDGTLTLNFTPASGEGAVTAIEAGKPYIIKWTATDQHLTENELVFQGVKVSNASTTQTFGNEKVQFVGTYSPVNIYSEKHCNLYLGSGNTLYYPEGEGMSEFYINACRAYFHVDPDVNEQGGGYVRAIVLNFGDEDEETGILSTTDDTDFTDSDDAWYTLDGRKLSGKPSQRGVYIHGGRKIAVQ